MNLLSINTIPQPKYSVKQRSLKRNTNVEQSVATTEEVEIGSETPDLCCWDGLSKTISQLIICRDEPYLRSF